MRWYCIHTKARRELSVIEHLSGSLGYEIEFPRFTRTRIIRRVRRENTDPLFPQYLFCRFDLAIGYRAVRYAHDVLDVVGLGGTPSVVPDALVSGLKLIAEEFGRFSAQRVAFERGEHVQIVEGPLQGLHATILDAESGDERVGILLSILGCGARLNVSRFALVKAS